MDIEELRAMRNNKANNFELLKKSFLKETTFGIKDKKEERVIKALRISGQQNIAKTILLNDEVHKIHAVKLTRLFEKKFAAIKKIATNKNYKRKKINAELCIKKKIKFDEKTITEEHIRFITIIDSVSAINADEALVKTKVMLEELNILIKQHKGINVVGCAEASIEPIKKMMELSRLNINERYYKLNSLINLACYDNLTNEDSVFSIHLHAVIFANSSNKLDNFTIAVIDNERWNLADRQVDIERIYKNRSIKENLKTIATYITKCSNKKNSLEYGIKPSSNDDFEIDHYRNKNINNIKPISEYELDDFYLNAKDELVYNPIDTLSYTAFEIAEKARLTYLIMNLNNNRTGYLFDFV